MRYRLVLALAGLLSLAALPATADCAIEITKVRQKLEALPGYVSTKIKQDAANHLSWAERALRIKSEGDCLEHVKRAREIVDRR